MGKNLDLQWKLSNKPFADIGFVFANTITKLVHEQMPDLVELFPFRGTWDLKWHIGDGWIAVRLMEKPGTAPPTIGKLATADLEKLVSEILPFQPMSHGELFDLLGPDWFGFDKFTYVGPYSDPFACWPHAVEHLTSWLNNLVVPEVMRRNETRVLRALPPAPQFEFDQIQRSLWVLECQDSSMQGTAFHLADIGLVTCAHVLGPCTYAFRANDFSYLITGSKKITR